MMKRVFCLLCALAVLCGSLSMTVLSAEAPEAEALPGSEFSTFDRTAYQDEEKYILEHSDSAQATFTRHSLVPDEEIEKIPTHLEGYSGWYFDIYYNETAGANGVEQFFHVYYPETTPLYEAIVTNAPKGPEIIIFGRNGEETSRTERETGALEQYYTRNIDYGQLREYSMLMSDVDVIYPGALDFDWKEYHPVEERVEQFTGGRQEGREIKVVSGVEWPDSFTELTVTRLDDERTLYTLYTVSHTEYDESDGKTCRVPEKRTDDTCKQEWKSLVVYQPKAFPEIYFTLKSDVYASVDYEAPWGTDEKVYELLDNFNRQTDAVVNQAVNSMLTQDFLILATDPYTKDGPLINKEVTNWADGEEGEDEGVSIPAVIILGTLGLAGAAAGAAASGQEEKKKQQSTYKMTFRKDFGDTLDRDGPAMPVYARIIEIQPSGFELPQEELTSRIEVFSEDNSLEVRPYGLVGGYMAATVKVPAGSTLDKGTVSFRFTGKGGSFTRHIVFHIDEARIMFFQDNLGLPALYEKPSRLPFAVIGMSEHARVSAELRRGGSEDVYELTLEQDGEYRTLWYANLREKPRAEGAPPPERKEAGTTEGYQLHVTAEIGQPGAAGYLKKERDFPVYRIWLGLSMVIEATGIGCYMTCKPGREGIEHPTVNDIMPCRTEASLLLLDWDEKAHSIVRVSVLPRMTEEELAEGRGAALRITPKRVGNDRYAHIGDATQDHQNLVDALDIRAFPTADLCENGARKLILCSTRGALDPPTRMIAELELSVTYQGREYSVRKEVLLRSQKLRVARSTAEEAEFSRQDAHIRERLEHIQGLIWNNYMGRLFSLYNLIDRMLDGYDKRFGYDANQVANVLEIWTGFLRGTHTGANGEGVQLTLADELRACYAFLQGLRDNTGILGRMAMGVITSGYSEYVFTAMSVLEETYEGVMSCRGDKDFGYLDVFVICVKEYEKQALMELAMRGAGQAAKGLAKETGGVIDVFKVAEAAGARYRAAMDKWDASLCANSRLYKAGAEALQKTQNYFNSLAKGAKSAIDESAQATEQAAAKAEQRIAEAKKKLTPEELRGVKEYDEAMAEGLKKVQKLKDAQQKLAKTHGPEKELARREYKQAANEVWTDKNALKQLQRSQDPYAKNMRYEFNRYREGTLNRVEELALDDIARERGIPREELYVSNATSNQNFDYTSKIPGDRDSTFNRIVHSDRSQDFALSQDWGEKAMARNLYKELNGVDPPSIEEALRFMKAKDVTYVCPEGSYYMNHVIEPNMDAYADLGGMIGLTKAGVMDKTLLNQELKGLALNQKTVAHKGKEWFTRDANESLAKAAACEREAAGLTGPARKAKLTEARSWRYTAQGQKVEGVRQITKQFDRVIDVRNTYSVGRGNPSAITPEIREIHSIALQVGSELSPAEFECILRRDYNLNLDGYADLMAKCLV